MQITIDKAGRVVIPKALRTQFHLAENTSIELIPDGDGIRLRIPQRGATLVEKDGILVQSAETSVPIDATAFINQLREGRSLNTAGARHDP